MSEVERYWIDPSRLVQEGWHQDNTCVVKDWAYDRVVAERDALQQRLTAADERNDEAIDLLRRARAVIEGGGWADLERDIASFLNNNSALNPAETVAGHHPACRAVDDYKPGNCSHGCNPAASPQGEQVAHMPIERCYDVRAKMIIAFNEARNAGGDLDDALDAAYKSALRYSPNPLSSEQPAPVAVALPGRADASNGSHDHQSGWNACLDELKRLNPSL